MMLDEIESYLETQGLAGGSTGWKLYRGLKPPSPDKVVVLFAGAGGAPQTRVGMDHPDLQVLVRGDRDEYSAASEKISAIYDALHGKSGTFGGHYYSGIRAHGSPAGIGPDANDRPELVCNFRMDRSR